MNVNLTKLVYDQNGKNPPCTHIKLILPLSKPDRAMTASPLGYEQGGSGTASVAAGHVMLLMPSHWLTTRIS